MNQNESEECNSSLYGRSQNEFNEESSFSQRPANVKKSQERLGLYKELHFLLQEFQQIKTAVSLNDIECEVFFQVFLKKLDYNFVGQLYIKVEDYPPIRHALNRFLIKKELNSNKNLEELYLLFKDIYKEMKKVEKGGNEVRSFQKVQEIFEWANDKFRDQKELATVVMEPNTLSQEHNIQIQKFLGKYQKPIEMKCSSQSYSILIYLYDKSGKIVSLRKFSENYSQMQEKLLLINITNSQVSCYLKVQKINNNLTTNEMTSSSNISLQQTYGSMRNLQKPMISQKVNQYDSNQINYIFQADSQNEEFKNDLENESAAHQECQCEFEFQNQAEEEEEEEKEKNAQKNGNRKDSSCQGKYSGSNKSELSSYSKGERVLQSQDYSLEIDQVQESDYALQIQKAVENNSLPASKTGAHKRKAEKQRNEEQ